MLFLSDFNKNWNEFTNFSQETSNITFHVSPSVWGRVVPFGWTDMTNLIVVFSNRFSKESKNAPMTSLRHARVCVCVCVPFKFETVNP